ncbi:MAG TPA: PEGA domain-containing protein [Terriglobia bacterium]|nr:PEGA domain-containing protein [Terriglobia bacterium]
MKEWSFPQRLSPDDPGTDLANDFDSPRPESLSIQLFEDKEAVDGAREIQALLTSNDTSKALLACDRMLSVHPGNRLFEGLRLEIEKKEREVRLEFIRQLSAELERVPDLDYRIEAIQHALNRYPTESQLSQLLRNAQATRDFFTGLVAEARQEEMHEKYLESLKRWNVIRILFPAMPGLGEEIHRVETLTHTQARIRRRAEFVEAIARLCSTGEYARAVYQCINALAEYPNDLGLLALKKSAEEKVRHSTELQQFISEGLTFLQGREADAALEAFAKARSLDQNNLQVRYLVGIALVEKARSVMYHDRQKMTALIDEAKALIPDHPELQALTSELDPVTNGSAEQPAVLTDFPQPDLQQTAVEPPRTVSPAPIVPISAIPQPSPLPAVKSHVAEPTRKDESFRRLAIASLVVLFAIAIVWLVYSAARKGPQPGGSAPVAAASTNVDIKVMPEGAEILVDGQKIGDSQVQAALTRGTHTVTASLSGYDSRTLPVEVGSEATALQINLLPTLLNLNILTDQPGGTVWLDDQNRGDITGGGITVSGVLPGIRTLRLLTPAGEVEITFDYPPGKAAMPKTLPSRQIATVLFAGSADGKSRVECNCAPFGLKVGNFAELIRAGGLEMPLVEGKHKAELWIGKNRRDFTMHGSRSPVATIAIFSSTESVAATNVKNR